MEDCRNEDFSSRCKKAQEYILKFTNDWLHDHTRENEIESWDIKVFADALVFMAMCLRQGMYAEINSQNVAKKESE